MNIYHRPYTYLIGWSKLNTFYYGVKYAKPCIPEHFWVSYYTSSKYVKAFRILNGEPDIIQIRKTFDNEKQAILWEHKVLRRMNVVKDSRFLNRSDALILLRNKNYFCPNCKISMYIKKYDISYKHFDNCVYPKDIFLGISPDWQDFLT